MFADGNAALRLRQVTHINLSECTNITVLLNNPQLRVVDLSDIETVTDTLMAALALWCPSVQMLSVQRCLSVTDLTPLSRLAEIDRLAICVGCTSVTDNTVLQLCNDY